VCVFGLRAASRRGCQGGGAVTVAGRLGFFARHVPLWGTARGIPKGIPRRRGTHNGGLGLFMMCYDLRFVAESYKYDCCACNNTRGVLCTLHALSPGDSVGGCLNTPPSNPKGLMICYPWRAVLPVKGQRGEGVYPPHRRPNLPPILPPNYLPKGR